MYWLMSSTAIIAMIGVLAVADSTALPLAPLLINITDVSIWPLLLTITTVILMAIAQRSSPHAYAVNKSKSSAQHPHSDSSHMARRSFRLIRYLLVAILVIGVIIGSALQALISHQQADRKKVTEPMRVQALVRIEGLSDSVYDAATGSGYRQVATIKQLSPLVSELTSQDLDKLAVDYSDNNNSLSSHEQYSDHLKSNSIKHIEYRVLLNAYPNTPSKKPSKNLSKDRQLTNLNSLQPGDQLFMTLTLAPLATSEQAINNPSGFDSYRWLRSRHIDGVANIMATGQSTVAASSQPAQVFSADAYLTDFRTRIDQGRGQLRQHFYQHWAQQTLEQQQAKAVTLSLLTGDRSLINHATKDLYQLAGISHLLAISGTHVLFLAIILAGAAVLFFDRLYPACYRHMPRWQMRWWVMIGSAFIYALFTGFDVPAARTAWMLLAIGLVRLTLLPISTMRVLLALAVLMAWFDPYVLWQAGYWLSFIAVALLLKYDDTSHTQTQVTANNQQAPIEPSTLNKLLNRIKPVFKRLFKLQCWLFIALLPITLLLFGKASLWALVVNLFAIGLFGWVIVPLNLLAGLCYLLLPAVADQIWLLVSAIVASLHELLSWLTALPSLKGAWLYTPVNTGILLMALLVMLPWLLPRGLISRWLALAPLTLLLLTLYSNQQRLSSTPTLYVLPTGDRYLSAAVLQYPIEAGATRGGNEVTHPSSKSAATDSISWLFLADHRARDTRSMPSSLTADKLAATLEQQLRTLSIKRLEGMVVQTSRLAITDTDGPVKSAPDRSHAKANNNVAALLPMTVARLSQRLPTNHYWQAGRHERDSSRPPSDTISPRSEDKINISPQDCVQGKVWQSANGGLSLQVMTGWPKIEDASVWDCTLAIDSQAPIKVLKYNAADPLNSPALSGKIMTDTKASLANQAPSTQPASMQASQSRIVLDAATHQRVWQLWSLLCVAEPFAVSMTPSSSVTWLSHSASTVSTEMLMTQTASTVMTYDEKPLEAALGLTNKP